MFFFNNLSSNFKKLKKLNGKYNKVQQSLKNKQEIEIEEFDEVKIMEQYYFIDQNSKKFNRYYGKHKPFYFFNNEPFFTIGPHCNNNFLSFFSFFKYNSTFLI